MLSSIAAPKTAQTPYVMKREDGERSITSEFPSSMSVLHCRSAAHNISFRYGRPVNDATSASDQVHARGLLGEAEVGAWNW
jgi:hypothetical protein